MISLEELLHHILTNEPKLCQRECLPQFELVNLDDGGQEVRVALTHPTS